MKFFLIFIFLTFSFSQMDTLWTHTYGGSGYEDGRFVQQTLDGGFIIVGSTETFGNEGNDVWLIKTDVVGNEQWNRTFGGSNNDRGYSVQQSQDGGYIIAGITSSFGAGLNDFWLIKTNSEGYEEWNQTYGGDWNDTGYSLQQTDDGGYIIVGNTSYGQTARYDIFIIKTDLQGNLEWSQSYGNQNTDEEGFSVQQTDDGGFILVGYTSFLGNGQKDVWLIKTDVVGNEQWNRTFGGSNNDRGYSVQQSQDGGYIIAGITSSFGAGLNDLWLIKTDDIGYEEWSYTFGGSGSDNAFSLQQTDDGGYIIAGNSYSYETNGYDVLLTKTNVFGTEEWSHSIDWGENDIARSVQQTIDGRYIIAGYSNSFGEGDHDILLWCYGDPEGCTDSNSINFDPPATIDDGSCYYLSDIEPYFSPISLDFPLYPMGIYVQSAVFNSTNLRIGDEIAVFDGELCVGSQQLISEIEGSVDIYITKDNPDTPEIEGYTPGNPILYRYWDASEQIEVINVNSTILNGDEVFTPLGFSEVELYVNSILGCTDYDSINYMPDATVDDGSCVPIVYGCMDPEACNYTPEANIDEDCFYFDCANECNGGAYHDECGFCDDDPFNDNECVGCTDQWALNYDPSSTIDDGSCDYPSIGDISMDGFINVNDIVLLVGVVLVGEVYIEYMDINQDAYLNIIDIVILVDIIFHPEYFGCTDPNALNYNPVALYDDESCDYTNSVIDLDGNVYYTVVIGEQEWITENLKVTHYNDGTSIPTGYSDSEWSNLSTGAYAVYPWDDDDASLATCNGDCTEEFGNLYNWFAVNDDRNICPEGWHVPTNEEWTDLTDYLGESSIAGGPLKEEGYEHWISPNTGATNETGFTGLPGGDRNFVGGYGSLGYSGFFWSSTAGNNTNAWARSLHYNHSQVYLFYDGKRYGRTVRCIGE
jgi:uncharacterized protein (TIGR02145 family)